jgi:glycosyltransferase involved in cell wall biosynthesis
VKILILHQHFKDPYRGGAIRSYYLAKALVEKGVDVTVITAHNQPAATTETIDGIKVHYLPIAYDNSFGFWQRGLSFIRYTIQSARLASRFNNVQLCYAISVPLTIGFVAQWIKRRHKIPYVFEVGDLWPDAPIQLGFVNNYLLQQLLLRLEKSFYRQARAVVALSPSIATAVQQKVPGKKVYVLPNMADTENYKPETKALALQKKFGVENKFVVSYIGATGFANGLDYFIECARAAAKKELPVHFLLCGEGAKRSYLQENVSRMSLGNLTMLPFRNRDGVKEIMNVTDAVFVCYKPVPILETGSPNKYFDGLSAGKLILINFGGWIKNDIETNQCGVALDSRHPTDFTRQISPFLADPALLAEYQRNARKLAETNYSIKILGQKLYDLVAAEAVPVRPS